jgi:hypothetical protein
MFISLSPPLGWQAAGGVLFRPWSYFVLIRPFSISASSARKSTKSDRPIFMNSSGCLPMLFHLYRQLFLKGSLGSWWTFDSLAR